MEAPARHRRPGNLLLMLLILALSALVGVACGGDDGGSGEDGGSTTSTSSTSADTGSADEDEGGEETSTASGGGDGPDCHGGSDSGETGPKSWERAPEYTLEESATYTAELQTTSGLITVELLPEEGPCAVNNFVFLAREGYYDGVPFHRILKDFMVQTGDPTGTGRGGPGYTIKDDEVTQDYAPGTLAMANTAQPDTAGSQFFIVHGTSVGLSPTYSIFGKVTKGMDVLDKIASVAVEDNGAGETSKPSKPVELKKVTVTQA
jgi:cyclophilin family peptidyl-prolyl cis-trans isomerase